MNSSVDPEAQQCKQFVLDHMPQTMMAAHQTLWRPPTQGGRSEWSYYLLNLLRVAPAGLVRGDESPERPLKMRLTFGDPVRRGASSIGVVIGEEDLPTLEEARSWVREQTAKDFVGERWPAWMNLVTQDPEILL